MMVAISPDGRPLSQLSSIKDGTKQIPHTAKLLPERPQTSPDPKEASRGEAQFTLRYLSSGHEGLQYFWSSVGTPLPII